MRSAPLSRPLPPRHRSHGDGMRRFGIISTSLWRSRRFRALSTDLARLTYIYLHTSPHGNSVGAYVIPPELAALDMRRGPDDVRDAIRELAECRLIRHDPDEELIQIINFFRFNSPGSRKQLAGPLSIVRESLPMSPVKDTTACDLVIAMHARAMTWDKTVEARGAFLHDAASLVQDLHLNELIVSPEIGLGIDLQIALSEDLLIDLPIQRHYQRHYQQTDTQTDTDTQTQTQTQTERGSGGEVPPSAPPSSPAMGSRSGRKPPEDVRHMIAEIAAKSTGAR